MRSWSLPTMCMAFLALSACARRGPRDVGERGYHGEVDPAAEGADGGIAGTATIHSIATPTLAGVTPRVLAHASSRAIATTATSVTFGDSAENALFAVAKAGSGEPVRVARRAPMPGALAIDAGNVVWIGSPGDVVLRAPAEGGASPTTLRDRGIFTAVAASAGDVFFVEAIDGGGALTRITGPTTARLASFEALPRALAVDEEHAYVVTPSRVLAVPRHRGAAQTLATGSGFGAIALDRQNVYLTVKRGSTHALVRIPKSGGPAVDVVSSGVRDAPIAVRESEVLFFDDARPVLRSPSRIVSEHRAFDRPSALAVDADGAYVAAGDEEDAIIAEIPLRASR